MMACTANPRDLLLDRAQLKSYDNKKAKDL